jgi:hypothetical protein
LWRICPSDPGVFLGDGDYTLYAYPMHSWLALFGGLIVVVAAVAHVVVRVWMRPPDDLDDYDHEFEEQHPAYRRYILWRDATFGAASIGVLLLFLATVF